MTCEATRKMRRVIEAGLFRICEFARQGREDAVVSAAAALSAGMVDLPPCNEYERGVWAAARRVCQYAGTPQDAVRGPHAHYRSGYQGTVPCPADVVLELLGGERRDVLESACSHPGVNEMLELDRIAKGNPDPKAIRAAALEEAASLLLEGAARNRDAIKRIGYRNDSRNALSLRADTLESMAKRIRALAPSDYVGVRAEDLREYISTAENRFVGQSIPTDADNERACEIGRRFKALLGDDVDADPFAALETTDAE